MTAKQYALIGAAALAVLLLPGATVYYEYSGGRGCVRCHEIQTSYDHWQSSAHRNIPCTSCHGSALTFDVGFHLANLRRVAAHVAGRAGGEIHLKHTDLYPVAERCGNATSTSTPIGTPARTASPTPRSSWTGSTTPSAC